MPEVKDDTERWHRRDVWLGILFLATGALLGGYALLAFRNGMPLFLWGGAAIFSVVMLVLGGNAALRSLLARP